MGTLFRYPSRHLFPIGLVDVRFMSKEDNLNVFLIRKYMINNTSRTNRICERNCGLEWNFIDMVFSTMKTSNIFVLRIMFNHFDNFF